MGQALRDTEGVIHGQEERVRNGAASDAGGAIGGGGAEDGLWQGVCEARHCDHCGQLATGERAGGTGTWCAAGPSGERTVVAWGDDDRWGERGDMRGLRGPAQREVCQTTGGGARSP